MVDPSKLTESNHPALYYQAMLADEVRMRRYRRAIEAVVRPGDVVADLGTGVGVLALWAVKAGAKRAYAIDARPGSIWIAERVVRANGAADRVRLVEGNVKEIQLEEPVDVIVNELIGNFGTDEGIFESVKAFAQRNLKPSGRVLPSVLRTYMVPVEYLREFRGVWRRNNEGLDLRAGIDLPCRPAVVMHALRRRPKELAAPRLLEDITFGHEMGEPLRSLDFQFEIERRGTLQGFVGYFDATLAEGLSIKNYPCYATCHWENWNWPVSPPVPLKRGQTIDVHLDANVDAPSDSWIVDWRAGPPGGKEVGAG